MGFEISSLRWEEKVLLRLIGSKSCLLKNLGVRRRWLYQQELSDEQKLQFAQW